MYNDKDNHCISILVFLFTYVIYSFMRNVFFFVLRKSNIWLMTIAGLLALSVPFLYVIFCIPMIAVVSSILSGQSSGDGFIYVLLQITLCLLCTQLFHLTSSFCLSRSLSQMRLNIKTFLFDKLSQVNYKFFADHDTASIEKQFLELPDKVSMIVKLCIQNILPYFIIMITTVVVSLIKNVVVGIYLFCWVVIFWSLLLFSLRYLMNINRALGNSQSWQADITTENIRNVLVNKLFPDSFKTNKKIFQETIQNENKLFIKMMTAVGIYRFIFGMLNCFFFCGLVYLLVKGEAIFGLFNDSIDRLLLFGFCKSMLSAIWDVMTSAVPLVQNMSYILSCNALINEKVNNDGNYMVDRIYHIEVKQLTYEYGNKKVFDNFSCDIRPGDVVWLQGPIGSGKTTLIHFISGILNAPNNSVFINDININEINKASLLKNISFLTQSDLLFHDSIESNILRGNSSLSEDGLKSIAHKCYVDRFGLSLKHACGFKNSHVSFGQAKVTSLARCFAKAEKDNVSLLIVDEPFVGCNDSVVQTIINSIESYCNDSTIVIICDHGLNASTLANKFIYL